MGTEPQRDPSATPRERGLDPEPRRERGRRQARRARLYFWAILAVVLLAILVALVAANTDQVELDWVIGSSDAALAWIVLVAGALGWLLGIATSVIIRRRTRRRS